MAEKKKKAVVKAKKAPAKKAPPTAKAAAKAAPAPAPKKPAPKPKKPAPKAPPKKAAPKAPPKKAAPKKPAPKPVKAAPKPAPAKVAAKKPAPAKAAPKKAAPGKAVKAPEKARGPKTAVLREAAPTKKAGLSAEDLDYFKRVLNEKRNRIIEKARDTINEGMKLDEADLPDEYDMASSEYLQYCTLRLRGRERYFLDKIEKAIARIEENAFGACELCGDEIGIARLMARPETTLCIRCKESQERDEKQFNE